MEKVPSHSSNQLLDQVYFNVPVQMKSVEGDTASNFIYGLSQVVKLGVDVVNPIQIITKLFKTTYQIVYQKEVAVDGFIGGKLDLELL